jgi:hypothetical protein
MAFEMDDQSRRSACPIPYANPLAHPGHLDLQDFYCKGLAEKPTEEIQEFCPKYEPGMNIKYIECPECPSFFQLPVLLLMLITLLNDGTLISIGYDNVTPSNRPEKWNLKVGMAGRASPSLRRTAWTICTGCLLLP